MPTSRKTESIAQGLLNQYTHIRRSHRKNSPLPRLSRAEFDVLLTLMRLSHDSPEGVRPNALGRALRISPPTVNEHINALESSGFAARGPDPKDGRAVLVRLSENGRSELERASSAYMDTFKALVDHLGEQDASTLVSLLSRAQAFLHDAWPTAECRGGKRE